MNCTSSCTHATLSPACTPSPTLLNIPQPTYPSFSKLDVLPNALVALCVGKLCYIVPSCSVSPVRRAHRYLHDMLGCLQRVVCSPAWHHLHHQAAVTTQGRLVTPCTLQGEQRAAAAPSASALVASDPPNGGRNTTCCLLLQQLQVPPSPSLRCANGSARCPCPDSACP